jgi:hypothetical protein
VRPTAGLTTRTADNIRNQLICRERGEGFETQIKLPFQIVA